MPTPIDSERDARLDEVLAAYLLQARDGPAPDRDQFLADHPDLADDLREFFADHDRMRILASPLRQAAAPLPRTLAPGSFGNYEILGEIARGGMGVVYKARHKTLRRVVALKMLLAGPHASPADRQRFQAEAEAAASLDHPSIVPIYEVGDYEGRSFLAMKFMEGGSLARRPNKDTSAADLTVRLPAGAASTSAGQRSPRESARLVASVARAIDHAHRRGVLHRDLKPANILLDDKGRPHVSDFGLARRVDAEIGITLSGDILGTPAYMAPEQASGKRAAVTVAADIYGLGAILYELVTGRPPFEGDSVAILRQLNDQDPPRPRSLVPDLPRDLETILLKCLHKDPGRRYLSAGDLADDLDRFLAGQPILARPTTSLEKLWRWVGRSPLTATLAGALLVSIVVGFALTLLLWLQAEENAFEARQQRDQARAAREQAEWHRLQVEASAQEVRQQRDQADESFRQAHAAVTDFCLNVSQELANVPSLQLTRKALLQNALRYYEGFLARRGHDPTLVRELAQTYGSIAQITSAIGARKDALVAYGQALELYQKLYDANPNDLGIQNALGGTLINIGTLQDTRTALETSAKTVAIYQAFLARSPEDRQLQSGLALTLANRGSILLNLGRLREGEECLLKALVCQDHLMREYPNNDNLRSEMASTLGNVGVLVGRRVDGRPLSLCYFLRADQLRVALAEARPNDPGRQADRAASLHSLGLALSDLKQYDSAREAFQDAYQTRQKLVNAFPLVTRYQVDLSLSLVNLGIVHSHEGRPQQALEKYELARNLQQKLVNQDPGSPRLRKILAESHFNIGVVHGANKRRPEEGEAFQKARKLQEELVDAEPDNLEYRQDLGRTLNNLGINLWARKEENEAREVLRRAIASSRILVQRAPEVLAYRQTLNAHHGVLAEIEWRMGHGLVSAEEVRQKLQLWPGNARETGTAAIELARAATRVEGPDRVHLLNEAMDTLRQAVALGYHDLAKLRADPDLELLRPRADFQALLDQLDGQKPTP